MHGGAKLLSTCTPPSAHAHVHSPDQQYAIVEAIVVAVLTLVALLLWSSPSLRAWTSRW